MLPPHPTDILILSNGPGEVATWVRPVVKALRRELGHDRDRLRISLILSPCPNASGKEVAIAQTFSELDRIQAAQHFFPFLLWGKTADQWDWRSHGIVLFLGGDQFYPVVVGRRLGYQTVVYAEWEARWHRWIDRFGVMNDSVLQSVKPDYVYKFKVVGDLMAEVASFAWGAPLAESPTPSSQFKISNSANHPIEWIGLLPGSKPAKLAQGVPLTLAIAQRIRAARPHTQFVIPLAPTLDPATLAQFADPQVNPLTAEFDHLHAKLLNESGQLYLETKDGTRAAIIQTFPAYEVLSQCQLCLTTVGANTAELGALAVPMVVLLPTQQLDAMRAWDGLPGLLANLPGVGSLFAKLINYWFLRQKNLLAWPNIWAKEAIVPELIGRLVPEQVAAQTLALLDNPTQLEQMSQRLRQVRGKPGAADGLVAIVKSLLQQG